MAPTSSGRLPSGRPRVGMPSMNGQQLVLDLEDATQLGDRMAVLVDRA